MLNLSLISPSYNQRDFVERMLESVESQSTRPIEHLIFDAHSTDGTVEILEDYAGRHDFVSLYSGRDTGQTNAINLGFSEAKGDIIGWLNTDDFYPSETVLQTVMDAFDANPDVDMIYGKGRFIDEDGAFIKDAFINSDPNVLEDRLATSVGILQPASFMRRSVFEELGLLNEDLRYCMDYEYWVRIAKSGKKFLFLDEYLAEATLHNQSKTIGSRDLSLQETVEMVQTHYGYAPVEWLERLANAQLTGADGIIEWKGTETEAVQNRTSELVLSYNATAQNIKALTAETSKAHNGPTLSALRASLGLKNRVIVTAFDEKFYESGLTLISQVQKHAGQAVSIIIYDIGLLPKRHERLNAIDGVTVLSLPRDDSDYFQGYFSHRSYGFKSFAAWQIGLLAKPKSSVVWMDAGIAPIKNMDPIWDLIETQDIFFVDHDDKDVWPFYNINFIAPDSATAMNASNNELVATHIRAGLFGFKTNGRFRNLINEAYKYSLNSEVLDGDKHPEPTTSQSTKEASALRASITTDPDTVAQMGVGSLREAYGYFGHRHDQSIMSVLASRYDAPVQSAKRFCLADTLSSDVSKQNWKDGKADLKVEIGMEVPPHYSQSEAVCIQHRGTFLNYDGLADQENPQEYPSIADSDPKSENFSGKPSESVSVSHVKPANQATSKFAKELETIPADPGRIVLNPPSISLVTPNYNTADYIERTLESVLDQNYPNLQYVVVDGASTDGSQSIVENYADKLHNYVSEPDDGHSDALNKGFHMVSGDIMGWINSDDILLPGSLNAIGELFNKYPEVDWITGRPTVIDDDGVWRMHNLRKWSRFRFLNGNYRWLQQESTFWRRSLWEKAGGEINPDVELAVDFDLWVRFFRHAELYTYQLPLGCFRFREDQRSKLYRDRYEEEARGIINKELNSLEGHYKDSLQVALPDEIFPMEYDESYYRTDYLSICDTPTITVEDVDKREEVSPEASAVATTTAPFRFDSMEHLLETSDLRKFRGVNMGKRCFVMGNGPSLNKTDLDKLDGEIVFGCNSVFLLFDRIKWRPTYFTCVDSRVLPDRAADIDAMLKDNPDMTSFFPVEVVEHSGELRNYPTKVIIPPADNRHYFNERHNTLDGDIERAFSFDINEHIIQPYTVSITMIQIAAYMGFSEIYLIGCDTSYKVPENTIKDGLKANGEVGLALTSVDDNDANHFDPRYFGAGRKWHDPQADKMIEHHARAREACESRGIKIYNATVGGALEAYPRRDFLSLFPQNAAPAAPAVKTPVTPAKVEEMKDVSPVTLCLSQRGSRVDETEVVSRLMSNLKGKAHVMLDVGAHIGTSAAYFEPLDWSIYCFEPDPTNRKQLVARFGKTKNILIDPRAVSDKPATGLQFFTSPESTGISGLSSFRDTHKVTATVDATTVTDIIRERYISNVDFLKIDVEGFDFNVLKGVPWDTIKPDVIECEFEDYKTVPLGHTWRDIADYLTDKGYAVYVSEWHPIIRYGIAHDWKRVVPFASCEMADDSWGNILAFREDPGHAKVSEAFAACLIAAPTSVAKPASAPVKTITPSNPKQNETSNSQVNSMKTTQPSITENPAAASQTADVKALSVKTPNSISYGSKWYSAPAHAIQKRSPRGFELMRFARRTAAHILTRPFLLLPILLAVGAVVWIMLADQSIFARNDYLIAIIVGLLAITVGYVAHKSYRHFRLLYETVNGLKNELEISVLSLKAAKQELKVLSNRNDNDRAIASLTSQIKSSDVRLDQSVSAMHDQISAVHAEIAKIQRQNILEQINGLHSNLSKQAQNSDRLDGKIDAHTERLDTVEGTSQNQAYTLADLHARAEIQFGKHVALNETVSNQTETLADLHDRAEIQFGKHVALNETVSNQTETLADLHDRAEIQFGKHEALKRIVSDQNDQLREVSVEFFAQAKSVNTLGASLNTQKSELLKLTDKQQTVLKDTSGRIGALEHVSNKGNSVWFQHFNRQLEMKHVWELETHWPKRLSIPVKRQTIGYMAERACDIERALDGRLATTIEDIMLRTLIALAVKGKSIEVLEIGTLFATGAAIMYDSLRTKFDPIHFTLLDPLEGYYHGSQADILTGQVVNEATVRRNLSIVGMSEDEYTIIPHLSTEPEAMKAAAKREYDLLVIDGDHSYAGVKTDFENYAHLVRVGGYIIVDDYNSPDWPDVTRYVDNELEPLDHITRVGVSWRTCVYRVVKKVADA